MWQSVTSTNPNLFSPAVSERSLRSLKETAGSEPREKEQMKEVNDTRFATPILTIEPRRSVGIWQLTWFGLFGGSS